MIRAAGSACVAAALALSALLFALPSLYVPAVVLAALPAVAAPWTSLAARRSSVAGRVSKRTLVEGQRAELVLVAELGRMPGPGGELAGPGVRRRLGAGARGHVSARRELTLERRGRHVLGPIELWLGDAFGLAARRLEAAPVEVTVLPRVEPVRGAGGAGLTGIARARRGAAEETDVDGIGPYRPGTPASRIHWQALARLGELMERRLVGEAESWPLVVLDAHEPASEEALDRAVRAAASLAHALARSGGCRVLLPGDPQPSLLGPELRGWPALHLRLALVRPSARPHALRPSRIEGDLYWVTASLRPPALGRSQRRYLVSAAARPAEPAAFEVAGCFSVPAAGLVEAAA